MTPISYSTYYISSPALGSIRECECHGVDLATASKWFRHHMTNVCARMGMTHRVIMTDQDDFIVAEWKFGEGIVWPKEDKE